MFVAGSQLPAGIKGQKKDTRGLPMRSDSDEHGRNMPTKHTDCTGSDSVVRSSAYSRPLSCHDTTTQMNVSLLKAELKVASNDREILREQLTKVQAQMDNHKRVPISSNGGDTGAGGGGGKLKPAEKYRDFERLKSQCDWAMRELQSLRQDHQVLAQKCEQAVKDADMHRHNYKVVKEKLESVQGDGVERLKSRNAELCAESERLSRELEDAHTRHDADQRDIAELRAQQRRTLVQGGDITGHDWLGMFDSAVAKYETVKRDHDALRTRHAEVLAQLTAASSKVELLLEEKGRLQMENAEVTEERNTALKERKALQQHCTAAIQKVNREKLDTLRQLETLTTERDNLQREITRALASEAKSAMDVTRLRGERDAAVAEYSLVMSERDAVHREMETLSTRLTAAESAAVSAASPTELESLRRELESAMHDRDRAHRRVAEMSAMGAAGGGDGSLWDADLTERDAYERPTKEKDEKDMESSRKEVESSRKEVESSRKEVERLQMDLTDACQEAEVCKRRRDWAFSERDKVVRERESMRALCDSLRHERDNAVSRLADALRDCDELHRQRSDTARQLAEIREKYESLLEKDDRKSQLNSVAHNHSHDSAIDADLQEWEVETLHLQLDNTENGDLGFELVGGKDDPQFTDHTIMVSQVHQNSCAYGKLRVNDHVIRVNNTDVTCVERRVAIQASQSSGNILTMVVRRRRRMSTRAMQPVHINVPADRDIGISLEQGIYVSGLSPGSAAAKEGNLAVGDRIISVNGHSMDHRSVSDAAVLLADTAANQQTVTLYVLKCCPLTPQLSLATSSSVSSRLVSSSPDTPGTLGQSNRLISASPTSPVSPAGQTTDGGWDSKLTPMRKSSGSQTDSLDSPQLTRAVRTNERRVGVVEKSGGLIDRAIARFVRPFHHHTTERAERDARCKSDALELSRLVDDEVDEGAEVDAIDELDAVISQFGGEGKRRTSGGGSGGATGRLNGTWPKCRPHAQLTVGALAIPAPKKPRPCLHDVVTGDNALSQRPPPPPERSDSFKRGAQAKQPSPAEHSYMHPAPTSGSGYKAATTSAHTAVACSDYSVRSATDRELLHYVGRRGGRPTSAPSHSRKQRRLASHSTTPPTSAPPTSLDLQPLYSPRPLPHTRHNITPTANGGVSRMTASSACSTTAAHPVSSAAPSHVMHSPNAVFHVVSSQQVTPPVGSQIAPPVSSQVASTPRYPPSSSANYSGRVDTAGEHVLLRGQRYGSPSPCPSQQSGAAVDAIVSPSAGDFPYQNVRPRHTAAQRHHRQTAHQDGSASLPHRHIPPHSHSQHGQPASQEDRVRILSNQSVLSSSRSSTGRTSAGSFERVSERSSPISPFMPPHLDYYHMPPRTSHSLPKSIADIENRKRPQIGETRNIKVEKSTEPLGIQIESGSCGGIFVSTVSVNSLACHAGIEVGDQLLEVCGINMRNATYDLAANVLRQCGGSVNMLVQYNPNKYREDESVLSEATSESSGDATSSPPVSNDTITADTSQTQSTQPVTTPQTPTHSSKMTDDMYGIATPSEPRFVMLKKQRPCDDLGIDIVGGNATGIFVRGVRPNSIASGPKGLRCGDHILEFNGINFRIVTAEQAAFEISKAVDTVSILAQYNYTKYTKALEQPSDAIYMRALIDRDAENEDELSFRKDDIIFVDDTLYGGGGSDTWRAWLLADDTNKIRCGTIPSKARLEEELALKRGSSEPLEGDGSELKCTRRGSGSTRRSFFRRRRHQRDNSKDSRELACYSDVSINSDSLLDDACSMPFERVQKLDGHVCRPVVIIGPLADPLIHKLTSESPDKYCRYDTELIKASVTSLETGQNDAVFVDFRLRPDGRYDCITVQNVRDIMEKNRHCLLDIRPSAITFLHKIQIYPIVLFVKHKSPRQIRDVKDTRFFPEKMSNKMAKEAFEMCQEYEQKYKRLFSDVIPGGNLAFMCFKIKSVIDKEQKKTLWVPAGSL